MSKRERIQTTALGAFGAAYFGFASYALYAIVPAAGWIFGTLAVACVLCCVVLWIGPKP